MRITYTVASLDTPEAWADLAEALGDGHRAAVASTIRLDVGHAVTVIGRVFAPLAHQPTPPLTTSHLDPRDPVLVHDRVEQQPRAHGVRCEKEKIAVREAPRDIFVQEIPRQRFDPRLRVRAPDVARRYPDFRAAQPIRHGARQPPGQHRIAATRPDQSGQVGLVRPIRIRKHELPDPEPPQQLGQH